MAGCRGRTAQIPTLFDSSTSIARRPPDPAGRSRAVLRRDIFVADSDAAAHAEVDKVLAEGYRGTGKAELLVGSAAAVVDRLGRYRDMGFDEVMVRHITGDHALMLRSFELIGDRVMPAIRNL